MMDTSIVRGQIVWIDFGSQKGSKQGGLRPCVVIQNNTGNRFAPTVIVAAMTSELKKTDMPTHVVISGYNGIKNPSMIMLEQVDTVDKREILHRYDVLNEHDTKRLNTAIRASLGV